MSHYQIKLFLPSNWLRLIFAFSLLLPLFFGGKQEAKAKEKIEIVLKSENTIDVCGDKSKRQVIVSVNLGYVAYSDSLFAFNFELNYNQNKIKLHSALYLNTLAEFFEFKEVGFDKGLVKGTLAVSLLGKQVAGNKPLIAFLGDYLSACPDTTYVNASYFEFTDEYQKDVSGYKSALIDGLVADKPDRILKTSLSEYLIKDFYKDSVRKVKIKYSYGTKNTIRQLGFDAKLENGDVFEISDVKSLTQKIQIEGIEKRSDGISFKMQVSDSINNEDAIEFDVVQKQNTDDTVKIAFKTTLLDSCSCIKQVKDTSASLIANKRIDTVESVEAKDQAMQIRNSDGEILIENENADLRKIEIFTLEGVLVRTVFSDGGRQQLLKLDGLLNGLYLIKIDYKYVNKKIILIIN